MLTWARRAEPLGATVFHPWLPLLLTASGTRTFGHRQRRDSSGSSSSESSEGGEMEAVVDRGGIRQERSEELESASLGLWKLS